MTEDFYKVRKFKTEHLDYYKNIEVPTNGTYLDVGCADWKGIELVGKENRIRKSFGIDIYKSHEKTTLCDLNKDILPYEAESIDVASSFEVIEHINNTHHYIRQLYNVLKKDGLLYISTPNLAWWVNRILLTLGYQPANTEVDLYHSMYGKPKIMSDNVGSGHIHVFTNRAMEEFLKANGFEILKKIPDYSHYEGKLGVISAVDCLISHIPGLARGYVYICQKKSGIN